MKGVEPLYNIRYNILSIDRTTPGNSLKRSDRLASGSSGTAERDDLLLGVLRVEREVEDDSLLPNRCIQLLQSPRLATERAREFSFCPV